MYTIYKVNFLFLQRLYSFYRDQLNKKKFFLKRLPQRRKKIPHSVVPAMGLNKPSASRQSARTSY